MEDQILDRVAVEQHLAQLDPERRMIVSLSFGLERPADWPESWPPRYAAIGRYIGRRFRGAPLSEATIRYIRKRSLRTMRLALGLPDPASGDDPRSG